MGDLTRNTTLPDSSDKGDFHNLIDTATIAAGAVTEAMIDINSAPTDGKYLYYNATAAKLDYKSLSGGDNISDADSDTQIQVEESADEDIVRLDIAGTETIVWGDGTNEEHAKHTNAGTNHGLSLQQTGILAAGKHGLFVYSNAVQVNSGALLMVHQDNASSGGTNVGKCVEIDNDGTGHALYVHQDGALGTAQHGVYVAGTVDSSSPLFKAEHTSGTNTGTIGYFEQAGTGYGIEIRQAGVLSLGRYALIVYSNAASHADALIRFHQDNATNTNELLLLTNDGTGDSIYEDTGAKLTAAGVWTDAPSCHANKVDAIELTEQGFVDKLKKLKLFSYKKRVEVDKKFKHQRTHKGYILDDPTTPEELIARTPTGEISGVAASDGVNFLLAVCKELIGRIEALENA